MKVEFTDYQLYLLKRSLEHSIESGQFFFLIKETEELRKMLEKFAFNIKKKKV